MPRSAQHDGLDKFQRFRASQKATGMKLIRIWIPDPDSPEFTAKAQREADVLRGAPEEQEALDFIEVVLRGGDALG